MRLVVSMREEIIVERAETRDCLDRRLPKLLIALGYVPVIVPNVVDGVVDLLEDLDPAGLILSGGQDPEFLGGHRSDRDLTERLMLDWFENRSKPVLGICRGVQMLTSDLEGVARWVFNSEHAGVHHELLGALAGIVPSHHSWCLTDLPEDYEILAIAPDSTIEAFRNSQRRHVGVMWHPERIEQLRDCDQALIVSTFGDRRDE